MKLFKHQIWLTCMVILLLVSLFFPVGQFGDSSGGAIHLTNFRIILPQAENGASLWALGAVLIAAILVTLFCLLISGFKNFTLQKRLLIYSGFLLVGYYLLFVVFVLLLRNESQFIPMWGSSFPCIALILNIMSIFSVQRTEAEIIAKSGSFRLRD